MVNIETLPEDILIAGNYETREVSINGKILKPHASQIIVNHSPDGFNWGYGGSGPAQLALALLLHFGDVEFARTYYQQFKWNVVANFPKNSFCQNLNLKAEILKIVNGIN